MSLEKQNTEEVKSNEVSKLIDELESSASVLQQALKESELKWTRQMQKQHYKQYVGYVLANKKRGVKHKK